MDSPASPDHLSQQTVTERPPRPIVQRTISLRLNLRVLAGLGAGLILLGAFLAWVDPLAQSVLGSARVAPVIQGWPSLLIGLIALGVLALPQPDGSKWVSLPAAALGLAAAVIAVASAITTSNTVAEVILRFPSTGAALVNVTGPGVIVTIAGGILCIVAGLSHPPSRATEARLELRPGQPAFAVIAAGFVVVALLAGLIGAQIGSNRSGQPKEETVGVQPDLLTTPVIDAQVTPLGQIEAMPESAPTETPPPTSTPFDNPLPTVAPSPTPTLPPPPTAIPTSTPTATATTGNTPTPTATATFGSSPNGTPTP